MDRSSRPLNLELNLGLPGGNGDQEGTLSQVESNETRQQEQGGDSVGTNGNAASSFGHPGIFQFMTQPTTPIGTERTQQPSVVIQNEAMMPQPAPFGTHGVHQTDQPPLPAPTVQPSVVIQNEVRDQNNSGRNHNRTGEGAESERGTMEPNKPDGRRGASRECSYHYSGFNNNYGGFHGSTININNYAGEGRTREQNNPNRRQGCIDNSEINNNS